jgi:hypothetical protein
VSISRWIAVHGGRAGQASASLDAAGRDARGRAPVPFTFADKGAYKSRFVNEVINGAIEAAPVVDVPLEGLRAIQHTVDPGHVRAYAEDPGRVAPGTRHDRHGGLVDHPVVLRLGGVSYLHDGHHRATAALLTGRSTIAARLVDLDALGAA